MYSLFLTHRKLNILHADMSDLCFAQCNPRIVLIHALRTSNPRIARPIHGLYPAQTMDPGFAQHNPRIAQIQALRVTYIISILNDVDSNLSLFVIRASLAKADVIWDPPLCGAGCGSAMKSHR